jgi:Domain of unknown function (DUF4352)
VSFSRESRYRNIAAPSPYYQPRTSRRIPPGYLVIGAIAVILILCCCCAGLAWTISPWGPGSSMVSSLMGPSPTPTIDKNAPVPLKTKALMDNGLELTVTGVERPLKVEGNINLPSDQQFILVSVRIRNTKKTGSPIRVTADGFKVKGDGGLTYDANPKTVTIPQELTQVDIAPGASLDAELIFQIAYNDSGLKMSWKTGGETRVFSLETQQ